MFTKVEGSSFLYFRKKVIGSSQDGSLEASDFRCLQGFDLSATALAEERGVNGKRKGQNQTGLQYGLFKEW